MFVASAGCVFSLHLCFYLLFVLDLLVNTRGWVGGSLNGMGEMPALHGAVQEISLLLFLTNGYDLGLLRRMWADTPDTV